MVKEVLNPTLQTYQDRSYFYTDGTGVVFHCPVNGKRTPNTSYPRSELRQMKANGKDPASWSNSKATWTMEIRQAITALPGGKRHLVAGQIHDDSDDVVVIRLENSTLFVDKGGTNVQTLETGYALGTVFTVKFVASPSGIDIYYNGALAKHLNKKISGAYFKAGCYPQANASNGSGYGEVIIYALTIFKS